MKKKYVVVCNRVDDWREQGNRLEGCLRTLTSLEIIKNPKNVIIRNSPLDGAKEEIKKSLDNCFGEDSQLWGLLEDSLEIDKKGKLWQPINYSLHRAEILNIDEFNKVLPILTADPYFNYALEIFVYDSN